MKKLTILGHDATHVIFGLDTSLEEEAMLDCWVIFGGGVFKVVKEFYKGSLDLKETNKKVFALTKEVGYFKIHLSILKSDVPKMAKDFFQN